MEKTTIKKTRNDGVINVGKKPNMAYVTACILQLSSGVKKLTIQSRGHSISKAVDVAEILRNRFRKDVKIKNIKIGTQEMETEDKNKINISTIAIELTV